MTNNVPSNETQRRHDISNKVWDKIAPLLPGRKGATGRPAKDNRRFINAVLWILRTGAPWRDLPTCYGDWKNTHRRFSRWSEKGVWKNIWEALAGEPDLQWLMIDATHIKLHPHGTGAKGGNQAIGRTKGGLNTKLHLAVDARGRPLRAIITQGNVADCNKAAELIQGFTAQHLLADRGYDTNRVIAQGKAQKMKVVIPPKKTRKQLRPYDKSGYKLRHLIENAFLHLKRWRGIATRYAKKARSFLAAIQLRCIVLWATAL